ncbi:MAG: isopeptide-forming domain-containing fimbrial protein, partial [Oribacterium sp.]|nr:isopeptide-forming domain-containing fimbrial protein [Oribacterium sp.]
MKKNKFIALALAAGMTFCNVAATGVVTFAATVPTSQTIDKNSAADATTGKYTISVGKSDTHTYKVYQILTGTLIAGEEKLGNPTWGADAKNDGTTTVDNFIKSITEKDSSTGKDLTNVQINDLVKAQLADGASGQGTVTKDDSLNVVPGYYLIEDITDLDEVDKDGKPVHEGDAKSLNIVAVFNDITITAKKGTVESEKHVDDQNDSDSSDYSELKDSADYDIGDSIPYTLTMKLPADYANYKQYYVSFVDDMSAGLTYNNDAKIYYGDDDDESGYDISFISDASMTSAYTDGIVYRATIQNLKADDATAEQKALTAGSVITIKYTATLNSKAVIGSAGNPNRYRIDYSSNPNQEADGTPETNETPWDTNIVFTYKTVFNKVDANSKP